MMAVMQGHPLMRDRAAGVAPPVAEMLERAAAALDAQNPRAAEQALAGALVLSPDCVEARRLQGLVLHLRGDYEQSVRLLQQAHRLRPDDALIRMNLASSLYAAGEVDEALLNLRQACISAPDFVPAWFNLGKMYMLQRRPAGAVTALHRLLDIEPGHDPARLLLAQAQTSLGMATQAATNYRDVLRADPAQPTAWIGLSDLDAEHLSQEDVAQLRRALRQPHHNVGARTALNFALVRALEDQDDYAAAYRTLHKANVLQYRQLNWNPALARADIDTLIDVFARPLHGAPDNVQGEQVIFIAALPQAGSVMTEQVLSAHPQVVRTDELDDLQQVLDDESARRHQLFPSWVRQATPADWARLGRDYLARTGKWRRREPCFIDRNLRNWKLVGAALAMLPGARVVNSRRDPFENCFACYRQLFASGHEFSYDLDHMVSYWHDYDRLSRHWQRLFPDRFFEHGYEAWLAGPQARTNDLLDFCGLAPDPACFDVEQIIGTRQHGVVPARLLRKDSERSARYGSLLDRLRGLLAQAGSVD